MKKLLLILFSAFFISLLFSGCEKQEDNITDLEQSHFYTSDINKDVILLIKEKSITSETEEITLVYKNRSKIEYIYGGVDHLEKEIDGKWYSLPSKENAAWDMLAYILQPECTTESKFPIKTCYGVLKKGKYRIIKNLSQFDNTKNESYAAVEFTIN